MWRLYLCILEVESSDNVLLSPSSLDLLRLRKSTWVIGISIWFDVDSILRRCVEVKRRKGLNVAGRCLNIWCSIYTYRNYWLLSEKYFHFWISGMDQTKHSYHPGNSVKLSHLGYGSIVKSNQRADQKNNLFFQPFFITLSFLYFVSEWS